MECINWWGWIVLVSVPLLVSIGIGGGATEFLSKLGVPKAIALGIGIVVGLFTFVMIMITILIVSNI